MAEAQPRRFALTYAGLTRAMQRTVQPVIRIVSAVRPSAYPAADHRRYESQEAS